MLLDYEACGWVRHTSFADSGGWSITERGKAEGERRMAAELDRAGAREAVTALHTEFLPLNERFGRACTDWQVRPTRLDPMARNDHTDWAWDEQVLRTLATMGRRFGDLCDRLSSHLARFGGYGPRYSAALTKIDEGDRRWLDAPGIDSCHTVWIQFHEDLLATLGIPRGSG